MNRKNNLILSCLLLVLCMTFKANAYTTTESETLKVWYEFPTIIADGETVNYVKVYENDGDNVYSAFNMHFILPEGFHVNKVKKGRDMVDDIFLSDRASSTHSISCNMPDASTLKIISTSSMNDNLYNTDLDDQTLDLLFTVGLIADPDMTLGTHDVYLDGIKFVFKNADACVPANEPIYYTIEIERESLGILEIFSDELNLEECYDLLGRKVDPSKERGTIVVVKGQKFLVK